MGAFVKIYSQCFPSGNARDFCDHIFRTFDTDRNGFIDFKEFLLAISVTSGGTPEEKLNWAFSMYDADSNGWIDLAEIPDCQVHLLDDGAKADSSSCWRSTECRGPR